MMTYLKRLCVHFGIDAAKLVEQTNRVSPRVLTKQQAHNLLRDKPRPVSLCVIKAVAIGFGCNYQDLIFGLEVPQIYDGIGIKF
jgi:hypothetical protein